MQSAEAIAAFGALAHPHRLAIYRLLVERGPEGLPAGAIAQLLGLVPSSLTFHLQHLTRAGLLSQRRLGRQLIYSADFAAMDALIGYLTEKCCSAGSTPCAAVRPPVTARTGAAVRRRSNP
jgi:ArsR family transcriptional regulator